MRDIKAKDIKTQEYEGNAAKLKSLLILLLEISEVFEFSALSLPAEIQQRAPCLLPKYISRDRMNGMDIADMKIVTL